LAEAGKRAVLTICLTPDGRQGKKMSNKQINKYLKQEKNIDRFLHNLKVEMKRQNVSQRDLGMLLQLNETVVSQRFNQRKFSWHLTEILTICEHLQISPGVLFQGGAEYVLGSMSMLELFDMLIAKNARKIIKEQMHILTAED